jgi:hypothetical protein
MFMAAWPENPAAAATMMKILMGVPDIIRHPSCENVFRYRFKRQITRKTAGEGPKLREIEVQGPNNLFDLSKGGIGVDKKHLSPSHGMGNGMTACQKPARRILHLKKQID